jgi:hypothetical protein
MEELEGRTVSEDKLIIFQKELRCMARNIFRRCLACIGAGNRHLGSLL